MKKGIILFCMSIVVASCSNENLFNEVYHVKKRSVHRITAEQAQQNALEFVNKIHTTRRSSEIITVSSIMPIVNNLTITRSEGDSICIDTLLYAINFEDNRGFILASADDRREPVIAYVEQGRFDEDDYTCLTDSISNDSTNNSGYNAFMRNVLDIYLHDAGIYHKNIDIDIDWTGPTTHSYEYEHMFPLLKTKWSQEDYKQYCNGNATGCAATAISQICSFLENPTFVSWSSGSNNGSCMIDWNRINAECEANDGQVISSDLKDQVAHLMRYWGLMFNTNYGWPNSYASVSYAVSALQNLGYNATSLESFNVENVVDSLKLDGHIVFMSGKNSDLEGHGWVVDGYILKKLGNMKSYYLHCNWGNGGGEHCKNGYFLSSMLDDSRSPDYADDAITRSSQYIYELKTSVISK